MQEIFALWDKTSEFKNYKQEDETLKWLFRKFSKNTNLNEIILKITCLDTFYSTNLTMSAKIPDIAEQILHVNFDERVKNGDLSLVSKIAQHKTKDGKTRECLSFASKYCVWHNYEVYEKDDFVIFDSLVRDKLVEFNEKFHFAKFSKKELKNYTKFKEILTKFRAFFNLECDFRNLDWYLWRMAKLEKLAKSKINKA